MKDGEDTGAAMMLAPNYAATGPAMRAAGLVAATVEQAKEALGIAQSLIGGGLIPDAEVERVLALAPDCLWIAMEGQKVLGYLSAIPMNVEGAKAILDGTFDPIRIGEEYVAPPGDPFAAIYSWGFAGVDEESRRKVMIASNNVCTGPYWCVPVYARGATDLGVKAMLRLNFRPVEGPIPSLFVHDPLPAPERTFS